MTLAAFGFSHHWTTGLEEIAALLSAIAGALLVLGALTPLGSRASQVLAGIALIAGGILAIIALHYGM